MIDEVIIFQGRVGQVNFTEHVRKFVARLVKLYAAYVDSPDNPQLNPVELVVLYRNVVNFVMTAAELCDDYVKSAEELLRCVSCVFEENYYKLISDSAEANFDVVLICAESLKEKR